MLHIATVSGNTIVLRLLLNNGASVHLRGPNSAIALHYAAAVGHNDGLRLLLERSADIYAVDDLGATPLHYTALFKRLSVVKQLLKNGANYTITNRDRKTPVIWIFRPGVIIALSDN